MPEAVVNVSNPAKLEVPETYKAVEVVKPATKFEMVPVVIVVLLKRKLPFASESGIYVVLVSVFKPIPSKYFALNAYGTEVILFLGTRVCAPI